MSHYTEIRNTRINDLSMLMKAFQRMGYEFKQDHFIHGHNGMRQVDIAVKLYGEYLVGFNKDAAGNYTIIADWSYAELSSKKFISGVKQVYNTEKVIHEATVRGYALIQQKVVNGGVRLVLRKMT